MRRPCSFIKPGFRKSDYVLRVFLISSILMRLFITLLFFLVLAFFWHWFIFSFYLSLCKYILSCTNTYIYPHTYPLTHTHRYKKWRCRSCQPWTSAHISITWHHVAGHFFKSGSDKIGIEILYHLCNKYKFKSSSHWNVSLAIQIHPLFLTLCLSKCISHSTVFRLHIRLPK
jgi:hypothetical protein